MDDADNHKPDISLDTTSAIARLKQSNKDGTFNLGLDDNGSKYAYNGVRTTKDGNYVLIFDPERQVFVLHRLDSLFHMNVTRTPDNTDADSLRKRIPQLEVQRSAASTTESRETPKSGTKPGPANADVKTSSKPSAKPPKPGKTSSSALRKPTTKKSTTAKKPPVSLPVPESSKLMPPPPAPATTDAKKAFKRSPESEDDEDDEDDDGGLTIEYPGGEPPRGGGAAKAAFGSSFGQPPVAITRRFSDFVRNGEEEEEVPPPRRQQQHHHQPREQEDEDMNLTFEDATGSADEEDEEMEDVGVLDQFKLPSPVDARAKQQGAGYGQAGDDADAEDDDDLADLEADLEAEFEKAAGYQSESDVSEED